MEIVFFLVLTLMFIPRFAVHVGGKVRGEPEADPSLLRHCYLRLRRHRGRPAPGESDEASKADEGRT